MIAAAILGVAALSVGQGHVVVGAFREASHLMLHQSVSEGEEVLVNDILMPEGIEPLLVLL